MFYRLATFGNVWRHCASLKLTIFDFLFIFCDIFLCFVVQITTIMAASPKQRSITTSSRTHTGSQKTSPMLNAQGLDRFDILFVSTWPIKIWKTWVPISESLVVQFQTQCLMQPTCCRSTSHNPQSWSCDGLAAWETPSLTLILPFPDFTSNGATLARLTELWQFKKEDNDYVKLPDPLKVVENMRQTLRILTIIWTGSVVLMGSCWPMWPIQLLQSLRMRQSMAYQCLIRRWSRKPCIQETCFNRVIDLSG